MKAIFYIEEDDKLYELSPGTVHDNFDSWEEFAGFIAKHHLYRVVQHVFDIPKAYSIKSWFETGERPWENSGQGSAQR